ncbi:MAG TPA: M20/M25/M40 family metallo-hydrolase, partial [Thermomicrobiales bacterium]|nr:M20/M25/M40 family metallo-hydrolase [Thermomicrobiales bacterium]
AAEFVLAVEEVGRATEGLVATVGQITAHPGASNVVPGRTHLTLDVRHADDAVRTAAAEAILSRARSIALTRGVSVSFDRRNDTQAAACDATLTARLETAIATSGYPVHRLVSGAGHDAVALSARLPVAMLFVRCAGGVSHNPAESITVEDVAVALEVLDTFIAGFVRSR